MNISYLNEELEIEYSNLKTLINIENEKSTENWRRYVSNEMSKEKRQEYSRLINGEIDFEEIELNKSMLDFYEKAIKFNHKNIVLLSDYFGSYTLFILAVRRQSLRLFEIAIEKLEKESEQWDDPRDTIVTLTILYNCLKKLDINPREYFNEKSKQVTTRLALALREYLERDEEINTLYAMGYEEVEQPKFAIKWIPWGDFEWCKSKDIVFYNLVRECPFFYCFEGTTDADIVLFQLHDSKEWSIFSFQYDSKIYFRYKTDTKNVYVEVYFESKEIVENAVQERYLSFGIEETYMKEAIEQGEHKYDMYCSLWICNKDYFGKGNPPSYTREFVAPDKVSIIRSFDKPQNETLFGFYMLPIW
ncbi:MAG: hypothetical protein JNL70_02695 [Saprospiraceae bacterium]|nr:hypothetical protein [Saprospiraceae bacterium]